MSVTFTKLFSSITESTIWCEDSDTRIVWIAMLAMADKHGRVWGSVPGIANRARVPVEIARAAIQKFLSPDPDSRSNTYDPSTEGRRIEVIEGGWKLINHAHYRAIRDEEERREYLRIKQAEHRAKNKRQQKSTKSTEVNTGLHNAEAEAYTEAIKPSDVIDISQATSKIFLELGLAGNESRMLVQDAVKAFIHSNKCTPEFAADALIALSKRYTALDIPYKKGITKFFKEGLWKSPESWEKKDIYEKFLEAHTK